MALVIITVRDNGDEAEVGVLSEPMIPEDGSTLLTPAQGAALTMLNALREEIKEDRGLIQLLPH